eukprot:Seg5971.1 transcript_id=Seg5971.1/GoldUCD/mRNA.D3Y31 product="hypothetical protein" protein_id=Seg5971.1/GoldUCD/D3Y31
MPADWYKQIGRTVLGNAARDEQRQKRKDSGNYEVLRGKVKGSLREAVDRINLDLISATSLQRKKLEASRRVASFLINQKPLAETKVVGKIYQGDEVHINRKGDQNLEKVSQYLPVCQIYIDGTAYVIEDRCRHFRLWKKLVSSKVSRSATNDLIESKIGKSYKDALEFMDTKRDQDILRGLLTI